MNFGASKFHISIDDFSKKNKHVYIPILNTETHTTCAFLKIDPTNMHDFNQLLTAPKENMHLFQHMIETESSEIRDSQKSTLLSAAISDRHVIKNLLFAIQFLE